ARLLRQRRQPRPVALPDPALDGRGRDAAPLLVRLGARPRRADGPCPRALEAALARGARIRRLLLARHPRRRLRGGALRGQRRRPDPGTLLLRDPPPDR